MLNLDRAKKHPSIFRRLTGISLEAFNNLTETLNKAYHEFELDPLAREDRKRDIGAGGKFKLSLEQRVFMTLFFLRHYPTFALLEFRHYKSHLAFGAKGFMITGCSPLTQRL